MVLGFCLNYWTPMKLNRYENPIKALIIPRLAENNWNRLSDYGQE
jgi:hypothetical protein